MAQFFFSLTISSTLALHALLFLNLQTIMDTVLVLLITNNTVFYTFKKKKKKADEKNLRPVAEYFKNYGNLWAQCHKAWHEDDWLGMYYNNNIYFFFN